METLTRRQIRYICFRLQIEEEGGNKVTKDGVLKFTEEVKAHMEAQDDFGGWKKFGKTWDVDEKSPLVVVLRTSSIQSDWNKVLLQEAKPLPKPPKTTTITEVPNTKKTANASQSAPQRGPDGKFISGNTTQTTESKKKGFWSKLI